MENLSFNFQDVFKVYVKFLELSRHSGHSADQNTALTLLNLHSKYTGIKLAIKSCPYSILCSDKDKFIKKTTTLRTPRGQKIDYNDFTYVDKPLQLW